MAKGTGGTNATTTLQACYMPGSFQTPAGVVFPNTGGGQTGVQTDSDIAFINQAIKDDLYAGVGNAQGSQLPYPIPTGGWSRQGVLYIPNRGLVKVLPGDVVMIDAVGWPILVSHNSIINGGGWTTTATG